MKIIGLNIQVMPYVCNVSDCKCVDVTLSYTNLKWLLLPQILRLQGKFFDSCQKEFKCFSMWLFWGARYILQQFQKTQFIVRVFEKVTLPRQYKCKFKRKIKISNSIILYAMQNRGSWAFPTTVLVPIVLQVFCTLRASKDLRTWKWLKMKIVKNEEEGNS